MYKVTFSTRQAAQRIINAPDLEEHLVTDGRDSYNNIRVWAEDPTKSALYRRVCARKGRPVKQPTPAPSRFVVQPAAAEKVVRAAQPPGAIVEQNRSINAMQQELAARDAREQLHRSEYEAQLEQRLRTAIADEQKKMAIRTSTELERLGTGGGETAGLIKSMMEAQQIQFQSFKEEVEAALQGQLAPIAAAAAVQRRDLDEMKKSAEDRHTGLRGEFRKVTTELTSATKKLAARETQLDLIQQQLEISATELTRIRREQDKAKSDHITWVDQWQQQQVLDRQRTAREEEALAKARQAQAEQMDAMKKQLAELQRTADSEDEWMSGEEGHAREEATLESGDDLAPTQPNAPPEAHQPETTGGGQPNMDVDGVEHARTHGQNQTGPPTLASPPPQVGNTSAKKRSLHTPTPPSPPTMKLLAPPPTVELPTAVVDTGLTPTGGPSPVRSEQRGGSM